MEEISIEDAVQSLSIAARQIAIAITPPAVGQDALGGHVESLTEAVMGITAGLNAVAAAIEQLAETVRDKNFSE